MKLSITDNKIIINDINFNVATAETILAICHKYKHMYLDGYAHGRKTRKKFAETGIRFEKWESSPRVCITYTFSKLNENTLVINSMISNVNRIERQHTPQALGLFMQKWQQDVADEIVSELDQ